MSQGMAEARGRVKLRPWRTGILVDTTSTDQVRGAIAQLSSVWGGRYMPILDINCSLDELKRLASLYDVDSLYSDVVDRPVGELLDAHGLRWRGQGPWGPFGDESRLRKGLLPVRALTGASTGLIQPTWDSEHPAGLAFAAIWGLDEDVAFPSSGEPEEQRPRLLPLGELDATTASGKPIVGILEATTIRIEPVPSDYPHGYTGIYVMRPGHPQDVVEFWNLRVYGRKIIGIPEGCAEGVLDSLLAERLPHVELLRGDGSGAPERVAPVVGLGDASGRTATAIKAAAVRDGVSLFPEDRGGLPRYVFPGLRTKFVRSIRTDFRPEASWVDIALPAFELCEEPDAFRRGVIAADVAWHSVVGQDPRMTSTLPPFPQEAALLRRNASMMDVVDHVRVTHGGIALGIDAGNEHARVPFAFNQDAIRLLFNDDSVTATQSDAGRFQTRAAQKLGGPFTGLFNQPGVREAITLASQRAGVALPHLRAVVAKARGEWPDSLFGPRIDAKDYAKREIDFLFHSGMFVPTLRVHCSYCRVESHVAADDLRTVMTCEFCGQAFNLALSHSLAQPEWRYRLAAHLGRDKIQALLPVLAAASLMRQLRLVEEPPLAHVLGLELKVGNRKVEADLAAYVPGRDWTLVLAEIKSGNRIDTNDIANLEFLRQKLADADVRCLLMFATLKDQLGPEEVAALRALIERAPAVQLSRGEIVANLPLVLTGPDLSHPPGSEAHPWRWEDESYSGLFGTALASCRRNLGLRAYRFDHAPGDSGIICEWETLTMEQQGDTRDPRGL